LRRRKKWTKSRDLQYLVAFVVVATLVTSGIAYGILHPPSSERFFAMWILGSEGLAEHYYPDDDPNLGMGEEVDWALGVYNHMGSIQYVVVRVKLLNSTIAGPDEVSGTPSPVSPILEFTRVLADNETWSIPFGWRIESLGSKDSNIVLTALSINQVPFNGQLVSAVSGFNYRFVFELWFYDGASGDLAFSWRSDRFSHSVWTQMWFNATATD